MKFYITILSLIILDALQASSAQTLPFDAREATISSIHDAIFSGRTTCRIVTLSFLARIRALNPSVNALISLDPTALATAAALDATFAAGNATGPLFCVPVVLKDNFDTQNLPTTAGSLALADSIPAVDATAVRAIKEAGGLILGKSNLHELALAGLGVSSYGGQTLNPYDLSRTPGGSSGGSGAAVAASLSVLATGTDTVNSVRNPASANSLVGCRPTRGRISRGGVLPVSETQDSVGFIGRSVYDVAVAMTVLAAVGIDDRDEATRLTPRDLQRPNYVEGIAKGNLRGVRFGLLEGFIDRNVGEEILPVNAAMENMLNVLQKAGATIVPIEESIYNATAISDTLDVQQFEFREGINAYLMSNSKASGKRPSSLDEMHNSGRFLVIPSQYDFIKIAQASSTLDKEYAIRKRGIENLRRSLQETFTRNKLDAVIYPEQKSLVVKVGSSSQSGRNGILAAVTGFPAIAIPAGFSKPSDEAPRGIPIGMEILGQPWTESRLFQLAYQIENLTDVRRMPAIADLHVEVEKLKSVPLIAPNCVGPHIDYPLGTI